MSSVRYRRCWTTQVAAWILRPQQMTSMACVLLLKPTHNCELTHSRKLVVLRVSISVTLEYMTGTDS